MNEGDNQENVFGAKQKIIWGVIGALAILILLGIFWLGKMYGIKKSAFRTGENTNTDKMISEIGDGGKVGIDENSGTVTIEKPVPKENTTPTEKEENSAIPDAKELEKTGWLAYTVENQGYKFKYPATAKIEFLDPSHFEPGSAPPSDSCVTIRLAGGFVTIFGKNNDPNMAGVCLGTGLGTEWGPTGKFKAEIFGEEQILDGMKTSSASAGYRKEFYVFNAESGERIKFGIEVNEKYAPEVTYEEAKTEVLDVLKTIEHL